MSLSLATNTPRNPQPTLAGYVADLSSIIARQRHIALISFLTILGGALLFGIFSSDRYESSMEILVDHGQLRRAEPVATGAATDDVAVLQQNTITEEELNSEIALLRNQDILREVVITCGLNLRIGLLDRLSERSERIFHRLGGRGDIEEKIREQRVDKAIRSLANKLQAGSLKMSNIIVVTYRSSDPALAARVLRTLAASYLREHASAHRPPGGSIFFAQETEKAHSELEEAEAKLVRFTQDGGVASGQLELENTLRRLNDVMAQQSQSRANIASTEERIRLLDSQLKLIPSRQTTLLKSSDNAQLLEQLKATLLNLQLKRTELLTKYAPSYAPVQEVDLQIKQTEGFITEAEHAQWQEKTTDRDPNYELIREELTRARAELAGLQAGAMSLTREAFADETSVKSVQRQSIEQRELMRNAKAAEDNYQLYLRKSEEGRISEALDRAKILNVTIAQAATVPALPMHPFSWYFVLGGLLALLGSAGSAVLADSLDPTLRTVDEVEWLLGTSVLAVLPLIARKDRAETNTDELPLYPGEAA